MERKIDINVDSIIDKLLTARSTKTSKQINLLENEIKGLCHKSREIFMQQPIFLELEAPLKVCGKTITMQAIFTDSTLICSDFSNMESIPLSQIICFWETMWTEGKTLWRSSACCWHTKSSTLAIFSC